MRILLTNDDGIRAPGIIALYEAIAFGTDVSPGPLSGSCEVLVVAPLTVQSATGHGVTFHEPLTVREESLLTRAGTVTGLAVDGRPADCVKLAVSALWPERMGAGSKPDIILSGMNAGANCGINVIYSGTVAAAIEGAFLGIPSIAVSMRMSTGKVRFDLGARRARAALDVVLRHGKPRPYEVISMNIPSTQDRSTAARQPEPAFDPSAPAHMDPMTIPPIRVCPMNTHGLVDKYDRRVNPMGEVYYWAAGHGLDFHSTELDSDVDLLMHGHTTVTPLRFDLTNHSSLDFWRERVEGPALG